MQVLNNEDRPRTGLPGIDHQTLAGSDEGLSGLSLWRQTMAPGCATPPHQHDCEEVVLVIEGRGELHIGGKVLPFGPDTTLALPPRVPHQIFNTGDTPLKTVAAFSCSPVGTFLPDGEPIELPWRS